MVGHEDHGFVSRHMLAPVAPEVHEASEEDAARPNSSTPESPVAARRDEADDGADEPGDDGVEDSQHHEHQHREGPNDDHEQIVPSRETGVRGPRRQAEERRGRGATTVRRFESSQVQTRRDERERGEGRG